MVLMVTLVTTYLDLGWRSDFFSAPPWRSCGCSKASRERRGECHREHHCDCHADLARRIISFRELWRVSPPRTAKSAPISTYPPAAALRHFFCKIFSAARSNPSIPYSGFAWPGRLIAMANNAGALRRGDTICYTSSSLQPGEAQSWTMP
jgi:hypothetical protein